VQKALCLQAQGFLLLRKPGNMAEVAAGNRLVPLYGTKPCLTGLS